MNVFLSYSHADESLAQQLRAGLANCGITVWSPQAVEVGQSLSEQIGSALKRADAFVLLLTRNASRSSWQTLELGAALASAKPVVPVLADRDAEVPALLRDRKYLEMADDASRAAAIKRLCEILKAGFAPVTVHAEDAVTLVDEATVTLDRERADYDTAFATRTARHLRVQVAVATIAVVAAVSAVAVGVVSSNAAIAGVISAITALVGAAVGFYYGSVRDGD